MIIILTTITVTAITITSAKAKFCGGYVSVALGCLFVCLSVCQQDYSKSYTQISMTFSGRVGGGKRNNPLDFGSYW